ncbi:MAG: carbon-nitrogen hydrolase family protein [Methanomicrobiales archaeon]|nr:carbon-nitrogen hydrolase family protein [Methanomicrobiales archaeon]
MALLIATAQITPSWNDPPATFKRAEQFIARASAAGAKLIAFPEQFSTGWDPRSEDMAEGPNGPVASTLLRLAAEYGVAIVGSVRERSHSKPRNTALVATPSGEVPATYSKVHLFSPEEEDLHYSAGDRPGVFQLSGVTFGFAICYDLRFPALFTRYADAGVECVVVPSAWPSSRLRQWCLLVRARALDGQYYVAGVNTTGTTPIGTYPGRSCTADPYGEVVAIAGEEEELLLTSIDPDIVIKARREVPVGSDRRRDLGD